MRRYLVTLNYQTDSGQPQSARYTVEADEEDSAYDKARERLANDRRRRVLKVDGGDVMEAA